MDIKGFYNPGDCREYFTKPFIFGGRTIAMTTCTLLSMPVSKKYNPLNAGALNADSLKKLTELLARFESAIYQPLNDELEKIEIIECTTCNGTKKSSSVVCCECDGEGEVDAETDYNTYYGLDCKGCDGDGKLISAGGDEDCQTCKGTGQAVDTTKPINILGVKINPLLLKPLVNENDIEIAVVDGMMLFKQREYEGIIMGLSK